MFRYRNYPKFSCVSLSIYMLCYFIGLCIFTYGFVSINTVKLKPVSIKTLLSKCVNFVPQTEQHICNYQNEAFKNQYIKHYEKVVLIVVDALRADFITSILPNSDFHMLLPFTESLIRNRSAISFVTEVFSPTVTMPRIKTLMTGTVSNFIDVFLNLNAKQMVDDNVIHQAYLKQLQTVFYGDETWIKLFPNKFLRSEGTHSFFVSDFTEVDDNVTRNVNAELQNTDWTLMILHYLGVDHIGHSYGPYSHYLPLKLKEMDHIIQHVYQFMKNQYEMQTLIVICGDHGMSSSGSHGGQSKNEILTPLIFINSNATFFVPKNKDIIKQVDFAPTLSALLGIPIPINSFGSIIPEVLQFSGLSKDQILNAAFYNLMQLHEIHRYTFPKKSMLLNDKLRKVIMIFSDWIRNIKVNSKNFTVPNYELLLTAYLDLIGTFKQDLLESAVNYNESNMLVGLCLMWLFFLWLVFNLGSEIFAFNMNFTFSNINIISFKMVFLNIMIFLIIMCSGFLYGIILFSLSFTYIIIFYKLFLLLQHIYNKVSFQISEKICMAFSIIHLLSLFSSSFIEEEHQTWYFLTNTILTFYFFKYFFHTLNRCFTALKKPLSGLKDLWIMINFDQDTNRLYCAVMLLVSHRILRKWNQTGNKWQHLSDISDWIAKDENKIFFTFLILLAQIIVITFLRKKLSNYARCLTLSGLTCILVYKCFYLIPIVEKNSLLIVWVVYLHCFIILLSSLKSILELDIDKQKLKYSNVISSWILLVELIGRAYNIPLISLVLVQEHCLNEITWKKNENIFANTAMYSMMTMTAFFYIGNSNNLSTIDIFSGYTGLLSYQPIIVGLLLTCNTYSTVILWLLLLIYRIELSSYKKNVCDFKTRQNILLCFHTLLAHRLFVLSVYSIVMFIMRFHLFILSVFLPKFIYETSNVLLFALLNLLLTMFRRKLV